MLAPLAGEAGLAHAVEVVDLKWQEFVVLILARFCYDYFGAEGILSETIPNCNAEGKRLIKKLLGFTALSYFTPMFA